MVKIQLLSVSILPEGFILESEDILIAGTSYFVNYDDGVVPTQTTTTPTVNGTVVIKSWGSNVPLQNANVCFTLDDGTCPALMCTLEVSL